MPSSNKSKIRIKFDQWLIVGGSHGSYAALAQIDLDGGEVDFVREYRSTSEIHSIVEFEPHILALATVHAANTDADAGTVLLVVSKSNGELTRAPIQVSVNQSNSLLYG